MIDFTLGFVGTLTVIAVIAYFMGVRAVRKTEEQDIPLMDFGALESDLTAYVQAENSRQKRAA